MVKTNAAHAAQCMLVALIDRLAAALRTPDHVTLAGHWFEAAARPRNLSDIVRSSRIVGAAGAVSKLAATQP